MIKGVPLGLGFGIPYLIKKPLKIFIVIKKNI